MTDAEKREKVIRGLECCSQQRGGPELCEQCPYNDEPFPCGNALIRDTLSLLKEQEPRWIPVTERLPKCEVGAEIGNVEWISHGMVFAGCFGRGGKYRDAYFRTWTDTTEGIDVKDADCWRVVTLPEPPKGENDAE